MSNAQYESGQYVDLFKTSDALIHDCGSFTIEYLCTQKPVMYLVRDEHHTDNMNQFGKRAFDLHYKGYSEENLEKFVEDVVVGGRDILKEERFKFYMECLSPQNGLSISNNIIDAILGVK